MLIDTHAHLGGGDVDETEALDKLRRACPDVIVAASYDIVSSERSSSIARANDNVYSMVGVHPSDSQKLTDSPIERLRSLALDKDNKVVAIGEIGLDYHYEGTEKDVQKKWFVRQIELADELALPAAFHIRDAYEDAMDIFSANRDKLTHGGIMHCYSGSKEYALGICDKFGFYFSFSGVVTFKSAKKYPEIIRALPLDRILVETDSPYMTPEPHRGERNCPANVRFVAAKIAEMLDMPTEEVIRITGENACRLLKIKPI